MSDIINVITHLAQVSGAATTYDAPHADARTLGAIQTTAARVQTKAHNALLTYPLKISPEGLQTLKHVVVQLAPDTVFSLAGGSVLALLHTALNVLPGNDPFDPDPESPPDPEPPGGSKRFP